MMVGENGVPETPDWQLPRPVVSAEPSIPANIRLGGDGAFWTDLQDDLEDPEYLTAHLEALAWVEAMDALGAE